MIYQNPLAQPGDVADWRMEGEASVSFPDGRMRLEGARDPGPDGDESLKPPVLR